MLYRVEWNIDIEADSPEEAALEAQKIHRDHESTATIFQVIEQPYGLITGGITTVDTEYIDND